MMQRTKILAFGLALFAGFGAATAAPAQTTVLLTTDALNAQGTFYIDFQLLDGNGIGDGNSSVVVSALSLLGGSLGPALPVTGSVTGDPTAPGGLTLIDSDSGGVAEYQQAFTVSSPTSQLRFTLDLGASAPFDTPLSDIFNFILLQSDGVTPLPTDGPTGVELVTATFPAPAPSPPPPPPTLASYGTAPGSPAALNAPLLISAGSLAPEPSSLLLVTLGAFGIFRSLRRRTPMPQGRG